MTVLEKTARERDGNIVNFETAFDRICDFISSHYKLILKLNTQIKNNFVWNTAFNAEIEIFAFIVYCIFTGFI